MDVHYLSHEQAFVWDGQKEIENRAKHGLSFETACEAFFDDFSVYVDASVPTESRAAVIGRSPSAGLLFVVHLEREGQVIRVISARHAERKDMKFYEDR